MSFMKRTAYGNAVYKTNIECIFSWSLLKLLSLDNLVTVLRYCTKSRGIAQSLEIHIGAIVLTGPLKAVNIILELHSWDIVYSHLSGRNRGVHPSSNSAGFVNTQMTTLQLLLKMDYFVIDITIHN